MKTLFAHAALAACCTLLGAVEPQVEQKTPEFGVRGKIEKIAPGPETGPKKDEILGYVTVAGKKEPDTEADRAVVIVTKTTRVIKMTGGKQAKAQFADLKVGQRVQARFHPGPRILIYPPRVAATEITILSGGAGPARKS